MKNIREQAYAPEQIKTNIDTEKILFFKLS
jgi:hypothetical protein